MIPQVWRAILSPSPKIKGELSFCYMRGLRLKIVKTLITIASVLVLSQSVFGQAACLTNEEVKKIMAQVNSQQNAQPNLKLRDELLQLKAENQSFFQRTTRMGYEDDELTRRLREAREANSTRLCQILKEYGWPSASQVEKNGVAAAFYLLKNSESFELQRELLPVIIAAVKRDEIEKSAFAGLDESGGIYYRANKVADLNGVYEQVINDLGKVYSLGYKPTDRKRDGSWHTVKVQIPNRPDLTARTRPGYYSN